MGGLKLMRLIVLLEFVTQYGQNIHFVDNIYHARFFLAFWQAADYNAV